MTMRRLPDQNLKEWSSRHAGDEDKIQELFSQTKLKLKTAELSPVVGAELINTLDPEPKSLQAVIKFLDSFRENQQVALEWATYLEQLRADGQVRKEDFLPIIQLVLRYNMSLYDVGESLGVDKNGKLFAKEGSKLADTRDAEVIKVLEDLVKENIRSRINQTEGARKLKTQEIVSSMNGSVVVDAIQAKVLNMYRHRLDWDKDDDRLKSYISTGITRFNEEGSWI